MLQRIAGLALACLYFTLPAQAWKPTTHESLAEIALRDMLDDGQISIYRVDNATGMVGSKVGDFPVDPTILQSVHKYPAYFRAGVLGPDAYPDIATGQCLIHPEQSLGGSNAWLQYLWNRSRALPPGDYRDKCIAWTTGMLVHAAGPTQCLGSTTNSMAPGNGRPTRRKCCYSRIRNDSTSRSSSSSNLP